MSNNPENLISKISRRFGQMFSKKHPEEFLKHVDKNDKIRPDEIPKTPPSMTIQISGQKFSTMSPVDLMKSLNGWNNLPLPSLAPLQPIRTSFEFSMILQLIISSLLMMADRNGDGRNGDGRKGDGRKPSSSNAEPEPEDMEIDDEDDLEVGTSHASYRKRRQSTRDTYRRGGVRAPYATRSYSKSRERRERREEDEKPSTSYNYEREESMERRSSKRLREKPSTPKVRVFDDSGAETYVKMDYKPGDDPVGAQPGPSRPSAPVASQPSTSRSATHSYGATQIETRTMTALRQVAETAALRQLPEAAAQPVVETPEPSRKCPPCWPTTPRSPGQN